MTNDPKQIAKTIIANAVDNERELSLPEMEEKAVTMIKQYGKEKKKAGARSLARLGRKARDKQKEYFKNNKSNHTRAQRLLKESKKLEDQFDRAVQAILEGQS